MKRKTKSSSICLTIAVAMASMAASYTSHGQSAMATISGTAVSGGFDYTILLQNNGSTSLEGFWYAWTDFGNNLTATPSNVGNLQGWGNSIFSGTSIQWQGNAGDALAPGATGTFTFFSPTSPTSITTAPSGESVAYTGTIQFNEATPGVSSPVFSPTLVTVPEPSLTAMLGMGLAGLMAIGWRRLRSREQMRRCQNR
jgi:hypothetical protein